MKKFLSAVALITITCSSLWGQVKFSSDIRLNQIGFYPLGKKIAVVAGETNTDFFIETAADKKKVFSGKLSDPRQSAYSSYKTQVADFSTYSKSGTYVLEVAGVGYSYPFEIKTKVHEGVEKAAIKGFYFQRFNIALAEQYAGKWKRRSSPSHQSILIHPSAASEKRPSGSTIASPRGWIDAGDYNKYIVNSGITTGTLLSAYEDFSSYYDTLKLNIPETKNAIPDILDEVLWNLRWMLTMQDPEDGGVYHKCTNAKFDGMIMPDQATSPRYVVQKGTAAALNLSSVAAQAARIFKRYEKQLPGLADSCLAASRAALAWANKNPQVDYDQNKMNKEFDPDVSTGAYGDKNFSDEFIWANSELYATTKEAQYANVSLLFPDANMPLPSWNQVRLLGYYTLIRREKELPSDFQSTISEIKKRLLQLADGMIQGVDTRTYNTVMGGSARDFIWGSSAVAANQGIVLVEAYNISGEKKYLEYALSNLDYLLGRNATGYSFLTGYGDKTPMHIHHRPSEADGIVEPVPGLLAGGPNPGMQDRCTYASSVPDEAYVDDVCSYASNEIAINWNAPLVYLAGAVEALQFSAQFSKK
jgi:endoglucanase